MSLQQSSVSGFSQPIVGAFGDDDFVQSVLCSQAPLFQSTAQGSPLPYYDTQILLSPATSGSYVIFAMSCISISGHS